MDQRMFKASCSGDIETLHQLLKEDPQILLNYILMDPNENPLITATKSNQVAFARELLNLRPELASLLDKDGFRPLDIAAAYGNREIANEILKLSGPEICTFHGKHGKTPIHYAAMHGKVEIIDLLLSKNPDCAGDVTSDGETACHLSVKFHQFEVFRRLLLWLEKVDEVDLVNLGDSDGNGVLHCAVLRKQLETIQLLLEWNSTSGNNKLQMNSTNKEGLTPSESTTDAQIRQLLHCHGGSSSFEIEITAQNPELPEANQSVEGSNFPGGEKPKKSTEVLERFKFKWGRDSPEASRNTLLLIAALVVTVTFQAGINPPSHLFESEWQLGSTVFLIANTIALSTSFAIIDYLTEGLPFQKELTVSMLFLMFSYCWSMGTTKHHHWVKTMLLVFSFFVMPFLLRLVL